MKGYTRILALILCLTFLALPVLAEGGIGGGAKKSYEFTSLAITVPTPKEGGTPCSAADVNRKVDGKENPTFSAEGKVTTGLIEGHVSPLKFGQEVLVTDVSWYYTLSSMAPVIGSMNETFQYGQTYTVKLRFRFATEEWESAFETFRAAEKTATLNGEPCYITNTIAAEDGRTVYEASASFPCEASFSSLVPHIKVDGATVENGKATKVFDGKNLLLTLEWEKEAEILYDFQWYRDGLLLQNTPPEPSEDPETEPTAPDTPEKQEPRTQNGKLEILTLVDVKDSGKYSALVTATHPNLPDRVLATARTEEIEVVIEKQKIVVRLDDVEKNVMDEDPPFTFTVETEGFEDAVTGSPARDEEATGEDVGEYKIGAGTLALTADFADNYEIEVIPGTLTILDAGNLPVNRVYPSDSSAIKGPGGTQITVHAAKGTVPEDGILKMTLISDEDMKKLEAYGAKNGKRLVKGFGNAIMVDGKSTPMPSYGLLRYQIPLTEEEAKLFRGQKTGSVSVLVGEELFPLTWDTRSVELSGGIDVTYLLLETDKLGTVVLLAPSERSVVTDEQPEADSAEPEEEPEEKKNSLFLWVLIVVLTLLSVGGIVFTVVWMKKNASPTPPTSPAPKAAPAPSARSGNAAPQKKAPSPKPAGDGDVKIAPAPAKKKNVVSFDDLED